MIVCLCKGVSDREIRRHIKGGCDSRRSIAKATGAGSDCGQCACDLSSMLEEHHQAEGHNPMELLLGPQTA